MKHRTDSDVWRDTVCTMEDRERLTNVAVTLNGMAAGVRGLKTGFATVRQQNGPLSVVYCWETAKYIVDHKAGAFKV